MQTFVPVLGHGLFYAAKGQDSGSMRKRAFPQGAVD